ncbi:hypothetical protein Micbo1qcDRAFT_226694 [Microdochium bolleyi]|uniref:Uncharacterized protein n=1 Tax=Microdochium bolleyi TaxID=196109 RepID=A0A136J0L8_9PEZI|nr:hypothetical protein Micbo1qcDRAFT_226694 [Microdochium bolleyi]
MNTEQPAACISATSVATAKYGGPLPRPVEMCRPPSQQLIPAETRFRKHFRDSPASGGTADKQQQGPGLRGQRSKSLGLDAPTQKALKLGILLPEEVARATKHQSVPLQGPSDISDGGQSPWAHRTTYRLRLECGDFDVGTVTSQLSRAGDAGGIAEATFPSNEGNRADKVTNPKVAPLDYARAYYLELSRTRKEGRKSRLPRPLVRHHHTKGHKEFFVLSKVPAAVADDAAIPRLPPARLPTSKDEDPASHENIDVDPITSHEPVQHSTVTMFRVLKKTRRTRRDSQSSHSITSSTRSEMDSEFIKSPMLPPVLPELQFADSSEDTEEALGLARMRSIAKQYDSNDWRTISSIQDGREGNVRAGPETYDEVESNVETMEHSISSIDNTGSHGQTSADCDNWHGEPSTSYSPNATSVLESIPTTQTAAHDHAYLLEAAEVSPRQYTAFPSLRDYTVTELKSGSGNVFSNASTGAPPAPYSSTQPSSAETSTGEKNNADTSIINSPSEQPNSGGSAGSPTTPERTSILTKSVVPLPPRSRLRVKPVKLSLMPSPKKRQSACVPPLFTPVRPAPIAPGSCKEAKSTSPKSASTASEEEANKAMHDLIDEMIDHSAGEAAHYSDSNDDDEVSEPQHWIMNSVSARGATRRWQPNDRASPTNQEGGSRIGGICDSREQTEIMGLHRLEQLPSPSPPSAGQSPITLRSHFRTDNDSSVAISDTQSRRAPSAMSLGARPNSFLGSHRETSHDDDRSRLSGTTTSSSQSKGSLATGSSESVNFFPSPGGHYPYNDVVQRPRLWKEIPVFDKYQGSLVEQDARAKAAKEEAARVIRERREKKLAIKAEKKELKRLKKVEAKESKMMAPVASEEEFRMTEEGMSPSQQDGISPFSCPMTATLPVTGFGRSSEVMADVPAISQAPRKQQSLPALRARASARVLSNMFRPNAAPGS